MWGMRSNTSKNGFFSRLIFIIKFKYFYSASLLEESTCVENVDTTSFVIIAIAGVVFSFGFVLIAVLINKFEKRNMLMFTMVCASLTSLAIVWTTNLYAIIILMVATVCIGVAQAFISAFCVDIYPTNIRYLFIVFWMKYICKSF